MSEHRLSEEEFVRSPSEALKLLGHGHQVVVTDEGGRVTMRIGTNGHEALLAPSPDELEFGAGRDTTKSNEWFR